MFCCTLTRSRGKIATKLNDSNQKALMLQVITNPKMDVITTVYYFLPPVDGGLEKMGNSSL
jgi:hypothetical protein